MLISSKIKLVAAFNHLHIFIDPDPNPMKSWKERSRLFKLPSSSWEDYNKTTLSKGGGIHTRSSKIIKISTFAKKLLSVNKNEFTPDELIRVILKAESDLLWSAGIGTYVKGSQEQGYRIRKYPFRLVFGRMPINCMSKHI